MNWFYALDGKQQGPVDQPALDQLVQQGVVNAATLVWREGMANWQPYSEVAGSTPPPPLAPAPIAPAPAHGGILCSECGQSFAPSEVIRLGSGYVCARCKPIALQKIREGATNSEAELIRKEHISHEASIKSIGFLYFLSGAILFIAGLGMLMVSTREPSSAVVGVMFLGLSGLVIWGGVGLRRLAPWSRIVSGILSGIGLLGFPLGTLINGYILYLLFSQKGAMVFSEEYKRVIAETPDVKYRTSIVIWVLLALLLLAVAGIFIGLFMSGLRH